MTRTELATEAWRAWVKDKSFQSEDTAKGFMAGFNFCLNGKIKVEGGDKGELISQNFSLRDKLDKARMLISSLLDVYQLGKNELAIARVRSEAGEFLKEIEKWN